MVAISGVSEVVERGWELVENDGDRRLWNVRRKIARRPTLLTNDGINNGSSSSSSIAIVSL